MRLFSLKGQKFNVVKTFYRRSASYCKHSIFADITSASQLPWRKKLGLIIKSAFERGTYYRIIESHQYC